MIYLPVASAEEGRDRSSFQAFKRKCRPPVTHWWPDPVEINHLWFMDVSHGQDDGGVWLTEEEISRCVENLPIPLDVGDGDGLSDEELTRVVTDENE
jgi:hypothetical protein